MSLCSLLPSSAAATQQMYILTALDSLWTMYQGSRALGLKTSMSFVLFVIMLKDKLENFGKLLNKLQVSIAVQFAALETRLSEMSRVSDLPLSRTSSRRRMSECSVQTITFCAMCQRHPWTLTWLNTTLILSTCRQHSKSWQKSTGPLRFLFE